MRKLIFSLPLFILAVLILAPSKPIKSAPGVWENVTPSGLAARGIATDPAHPGTVYAGLQLQTGGNSGGQGIWKSTNYGATWARVDVSIGPPCNGVSNFDGMVGAISVAPNGDVYTVNVYGCNMGVFKSTDGGVTWVNKFAGDFNNVSINPSNPNHLLAAYHSRHDICGPECDTGVVSSSDAGQTWQASPVIPGSGWGQHAFFITSTTWLVNADGNGLFRTTNSGNSWTKVSNFSTVGAAGFVRVGSAIYTGVAEGLMRSTDDGATWTIVLSEPTPDVYMGITADATGRIYTHSSYPFAGYGGGPFKVSDNGTTWSNQGAQTFANGPAWMAADSQYVYAANWQLGLWRLPLGGAPPPTATNTPVPPTATNTPVVSQSPTPTGTPLPCFDRVRVNGDGTLSFFGPVAC